MKKDKFQKGRFQRQEYPRIEENQIEAHIWYHGFTGHIMHLYIKLKDKASFIIWNLWVSWPGGVI